MGCAISWRHTEVNFQTLPQHFACVGGELKFPNLQVATRMGTAHQVYITCSLTALVLFRHVTSAFHRVDGLVENLFSSIYKTVVTYVTRSFIAYFRIDSPMGHINPVKRSQTQSQTREPKDTPVKP